MDVARRRLIELDDPSLRELWALSESYSPSNDITAIRDKTVQYMLSIDNKHVQDKEYLETTVERDVLAIDHLAFLNRALASQPVTARSPRRLVLYVSSARRTRFMFRQEQLLDLFPRVDGEVFSFYRSREDIFVQMVSGFDHGSQGFVADVFERLAKGGRCDDCPLRIDTNEVKEIDCQWLNFCRSFTVKEGAIENLGLYRAISDYWSAKESRPKNPTQAAYIEFFRNLMKQGKVTAAVVGRRITLTRFLLTTQSEFVLGNDRKSAGPKPIPLRENRDEITSVDLYLPIAPRLTDVQYRRSFDSIIQYYHSSPLLTWNDWGAFEKSYRDYLDIDADDGGKSLEHEIIFCLLYLAFPRNEGDEEAWELAQSKLEISGGWRTEFEYLLVWIDRRRRHFEQAYDRASEAIVNYRGDPRFFHGRGLANFAWYTEPEGRDSWQRKGLSGQQAIQDVARAIELYHPEDSEIQKRLVAAARCNVAYFCVFDRSTAWGVYDVGRGRREIDLLKDMLPEDAWYPLYPEYYAAEAWVCFEEWLVCAPPAVKRANAVEAISKSDAAICKAWRLFPKTSFEVLMRRLIAEGEKLGLKLESQTLLGVR